MKNELIPNEKKIVSRLEKAESRVEKSITTLVDDCIFLGEELIEAKKIAGHGNWESFLNRNSSFRFATTRQASKFIRIAENKTFAKTFLIGETSIDGLNSGIASATPEQLERVKQIEAERIASEEAKKAAKVEAQPASQSEPNPEPKTSQSEPIDAVFTEVKPGKVAANAPELVVEETLEQVLTEANEILQKDNEELLNEIKSVTKVFESNDQVTTALAEVKKFKELNRVLNERITGLQNEKNEAIRSVKHWKARAERAEKELASKAAA